MGTVPYSNSRTIPARGRAGSSDTLTLYRLRIGVGTSFPRGFLNRQSGTNTGTDLPKDTHYFVHGTAFADEICDS